jgi:hypothetical protein
MSPDDLAALVAEANLAPSVHNTQPTRWRGEADGRVLVLEETARLLPVGDPERRDALVSHGAAIEGFALACSVRGRAVGVEALDGPIDRGLRPIARLTLAGDAPIDPVRALAAARRTYRGKFGRVDAGLDLSSLQAEDATVVTDPGGVGFIARLNDEAGLRTFRNGPYRAELLSWMRLSRRHPGWALDGLNAEAMEMSPVEAAAAGVVLRPGVFEALDGIGVAEALTGEAAVVRSAAAIVLFHRPPDEPPLETGRRFHRLWLQFTALGVSAAPMAVLADDPAAARAVADRFSLPVGRRLITAFRLGAAPVRRLGPKPRLPTDRLLV